MARRKLSPFKADEAGDTFTPTVKSFKGAAVNSGEAADPKTVQAKGGKSKKTGAGGRKRKPRTAAVTEEVQPTTDETRPKPDEKASPQADQKSAVGGKKGKEQGARDEEDGERLVQLVGFSLDDEEFGVDILIVQEINRVLDITKVPKAPEFVEGVINLRGKVIPVINLRKRFHLPEKTFDKEARIMVVEIDGRTIGFLVDSVSEVLRISSSTIEPPPSIVAGIDAEYISGVAKLEERLLILLDLNKLLSSKEVDQLKQAA